MAFTGNKIITKDLIFSEITSLDIFKYYCTPFKEIGRYFSSELRTDPKPSCRIDFIGKDFIYSDFGRITGVSAIDYVMLKYNDNYPQALKRIYNDLHKKNSPNINRNNSFNKFATNLDEYGAEQADKSITKSNDGHEHRAATIKVKSRHWSLGDKEYWLDRYGINRQLLLQFNVYPISHFWIDSSKMSNRMFIADELAYCYDYYWEDGIFRRKIYQPNRDGFGKWWSNGGKTVAGEGVLPGSGDLLLITKSLKDVMCLSVLGYTAVAPPSEQHFLTEEYLTKQRSRFKEVVLFLDQDETGRNNSMKFSLHWKLPYILIPEEYGVKDISDFIYKYSLEEAKILMEQILQDKQLETGVPF